MLPMLSHTQRLDMRGIDLLPYKRFATEDRCWTRFRERFEFSKQTSSEVAIQLALITVAGALSFMGAPEIKTLVRQQEDACLGRAMASIPTRHVLAARLKALVSSGIFRKVEIRNPEIGYLHRVLYCTSGSACDKLNALLVELSMPIPKYLPARVLSPEDRTRTRP
ncbi:hypothetical protein [Haliangium sp.]|uniref:hypothetical protein n=1 Tax=Haliangium sp. TaxID=2663208 RepID=UPI003D0E40D6